MATAKIVELDETNTCKICENALAKYSCPRCNILYCSLPCYQSPSHLNCSEDFYKESVIEALNEQSDLDSKTKMMEILQRQHHNNKLNLDEFSDGDDGLDSDDNDDIDDITSRLEGVDLDDAEKVWEKLTEDEKQDFIAFLKSEDVTKLIKPWEPWWDYYDPRKVEIIGCENKEYKNNCPKLAEIKDIKLITSKTPSELLKNNLVNILASYAFTTRYLNGEHFDFAKEAVSCWANLSICIKSKENLPDYEFAIKSVQQECLNTDWIITDEENFKTMKEDVTKILRGPNFSEPKFYILCALSDLLKLLKVAENPQEKETFGKSFPNDHFPSVKLESKEHIISYEKKIEYFLSYVKDCYQV